jgi:hypothetical protein
MACNVNGNGSLYQTILCSEPYAIDIGILSAYHPAPVFNGGYFDPFWGENYGFLVNSTAFYSDAYNGPIASYGCAYDADNDGVCDIIDLCHDPQACNYMQSNETCYPDTDNDGICDNLDGCYSPGFCNTYDPNATFCHLQGSPCDLNNYYNSIVDQNCICHILIPGCDDPSACNYNQYTINDGSCLYYNSSCDDGNPNTVNDVFNDQCICSGN